MGISGDSAKEGAGVSKMGICDVRDVAKAHVKALEADEAKNQRYIVSCKDQYGTMEIVDIVRKHFPKLKLPTAYKDGKLHPTMKNSADNRKVCKLLGVEELTP